MGLMFGRQNRSMVPARLPQPEEVFFAWLLAQPAGSDLAAAAQTELSRLERYTGPHEGPQRLSGIFSDFLASLSPRGPTTRQ